MNASPPVRLRDLGTIIGDAFRLYRAHFPTLFALALITAPLTMLAIVLQRRIDDPQEAQLVGSLIQLAGALVSLASSAAIIAATVTALTGQRPEFAASLDTALGRYWTILKTIILGGVLTVLAAFSWPFLALWWLMQRDATIDGRRDWFLVAIPLVVPAYLIVRWTFAQQGVMIDGKAGWAALDDSAAAVRGRWWRTLGFLIVLGLLAAAPVLLAGVTALAAPVVEAIVTALASALALPFGVIGVTLLYLDQRQPAQTQTDPQPEPQTEEQAGAENDISTD